uniref:Uncharacterized protein n=1 Tax=Oryzias melastigma TaxID=30732 RepID=A0A3B3CQA2_ORYME
RRPTPTGSRGNPRRGSSCCLHCLMKILVWTDEAKIEHFDINSNTIRTVKHGGGTGKFDLINNCSAAPLPSCRCWVGWGGGEGRTM